MKRNDMAKGELLGVSQSRKPSSIIGSVVLFCRRTIVLTALLISPFCCQNNEEGVYDLRSKDTRNDSHEMGTGQVS